MQIHPQSDKEDAGRYRKLRARLESTQNYTWLIATGNYKASETAFSKPRGEQFDKAVDALPHGDPELDHLSCPDCAKCKRHAYSDMTTPGFFYDRCEKHRRLAKP